MTDKPNIAEIRLGISLLFKPEQLVEFRVQRTDTFFRGFYFDDHDKLAETVARLDDDSRIVSLYFVINPIKPSLLRTRAECPCEKCKGGGVIVLNPTPEQVEQILTGPSQHLSTDSDVELLQNVLIDFDTIRAPYLKWDESTKEEFSNLQHECATAEEKRATREVAKRAIAYLDAKGWPSALLADSGNGYHAIPRVQMDNSAYNANMLLDVRKALAARFNCDAVKIDASVGNPSRLTRAYGSTTRKGTSTPERPHRRNRMIMPTESIQEVPLDQILQLSCELPTESRQRKSGKMPVPRKDFDPQNYFDWFETKENHPRRQEDWTPAFEIVGKRESGGVTYYITDICLIAGHKHTGSKVTGFGVGDSFGYHCFSDDCEGITLKDLHAKLRAERYELYPEPIFENDGIEDVPDFAENAGQLDEAIDSVVDEKSHPTETHPGAGAVLNVEKQRPDVEWLTKLLAVIFKDPKSTYGDFAVWRNRLQWLIDEKALPRTLRPVLELLLEYERKHRRLPTQDELIDAAGSNVGIVGVLSRISKIEEDITLDYAAEKIVSIGEASDERRTALKYVELLEKGTEHSKAREYVRKRWSHGISADRALVEGSVQDHQDEIFERFRKMGMGEQDDNPLAFSTPFPTINEAILSDQERCCAVIGPPNNFKTSVVLSLAYSLGRQGKSTLLVTGEHEPEKLEERITLLHGFYKRERFTLPSYKEWSDGKVAEGDVRNMRECCDDWKALVSVPGPIVVRHMSEFGYDLGKIEAYMEETHRKYQWKALVIDPFGDLLINVDPKERWGKGGELCQKLLRMKTAYHNNAGLIVVTTLQMKKAVKGKVEALKHNPDATLSAYDAALEASEIELFSGAVQRFDMLWGVASTTVNNTKGVITCARTRHGQAFEPFEFVVDRKSHYTYEEPRMNEASLEDFADVVAVEGL